MQDSFRFMCSDVERARFNREVVVRQKWGEAFYQEQDHLLASWKRYNRAPRHLVLAEGAQVITQ